MAKEPKQSRNAPEGNTADRALSTSEAGATTANFPATIDRVVQGVNIPVPARFFPGHTLTHDEALFASSALAAYAMNSFSDRAKTLKAGTPARQEKDLEGNDVHIPAVEPYTDEQIRTEALAHFAQYSWAPRGAAEVQDPVEREVRKQARAEVEAVYKNQGKSIAKLSGDDVKALVDKWLGMTRKNATEDNRTRITREAKARLDQYANLVGDDVLEGLDL